MSDRFVHEWLTVGDTDPDRLRRTVDRLIDGMEFVDATGARIDPEDVQAFDPEESE